jgi:DNA-binding protein YbaB
MASNVEPLLEPGMALDRVAAWQQDIDKLVTRTRTMADRLGMLRVSASDPARLVEVTVDSQGVLLDLRFHARFRQYDADHVSRTVMATCRDAQRRATTQANQIIAETIGTDSAAAREMISRGAGPERS